MPRMKERMCISNDSGRIGECPCGDKWRRELTSKLFSMEMGQVSRQVASGTGSRETLECFVFSFGIGVSLTKYAGSHEKFHEPEHDIQHLICLSQRIMELSPEAQPELCIRGYSDPEAS